MVSQSVEHEGITFHLVDQGHGIPLIIQHGLGGDTSQPTTLFQTPHGYRLLSFDFRGHGATRPLGPVDDLRIECFADDLRAILDAAGIERAIVGGISMGAAVALNFADRFPHRLLGLILSRPAWLDGPYPEHLRIFTLVTELIQAHGPVEGRRRFEASAAYRDLLAINPDSAQTLAGHFSHPRAIETAAKFDRIARDWPGVPADRWSRITVPTLVLANGQDPIHPFAYGQAIAAAIPGAMFRELTPKAVNFMAHGMDVHAALGDYLACHFPTEPSGRAAS